MNGLGRVINTVAVADGVYVPLKDAGAVTFICYLDAGDTFTVQEAQNAGGTGAQNLATITDYHTGSGVGGVWTDRVQAAAAAVTISGAANNDCAVFTISAEELSAGYTHVKCTSTGAGTVVAVLHDLKIQRTPGNLPALV